MVVLRTVPGVDGWRGPSLTSSFRMASSMGMTAEDLRDRIAAIFFGCATDRTVSKTQSSALSLGAMVWSVS